jgi:hypothetical protein
MSQPNLLELEAPIKICGTCVSMQGRDLALTAPLSCKGGHCSHHILLTIAISPLHHPRTHPPHPPLRQATSMGSIPTCCGYSSMEVSLQKLTTSSSVTTWTEASRAWKPSACCWRTRQAKRDV